VCQGKGSLGCVWGFILIVVAKGDGEIQCVCCWSDVWQGDVTVWVPSPMHSVSSLVPPAGGMALGVCWWELMFGKSYFFVDPHLWGVDF
jgi:hypothetical protein